MPDSPQGQDPGRTKRIGKYEILAALSTGGMAELYLAVTQGPGGFRKFAAVKKILPEVRANGEFVRMFLDEARITAMLSHPGIAQVYELGEHEGELFIAMEFVPGQDLARIIRACRKHGRRPPPGFACLVIRDTCLALHYAHNFVEPSGHPSAVIHRDIAPKNVMVTYEGGVKLVDFGIALAKNRLETTQAGTVKGTANYMSPEQILAKPLDGRTDLYSAAVILHELLTGQRLFQAQGDPAVLQLIMHGEIASPRELNPKIPPGLSDVVMRALSRDRDKRFSTGREMARALDAVAAGFIFDADEAARFMRELFDERLAHTRALLDLSTHAGDSGRLRVAAGALREEGTSSTGRRGPSFSEARTAEMEPMIEPQTAKVAGRTGSKAAAPRPRTILAVDDDPGVLLTLQTCLLAEGYRVVLEQDPAAALRAAVNERPDLALVAVSMPKLSGFELCRAIREQVTDRYLPVLFLTAGPGVEERVKGISAGGDDFVRKPFEAAELAAHVEAHLQRAAVLQAGPLGRGPQTPSARTGRRKPK